MRVSNRCRPERSEIGPPTACLSPACPIFNWVVDRREVASENAAVDKEAPSRVMAYYFSRVIAMTGQSSVPMPSCGISTSNPRSISASRVPSVCWSRRAVGELLIKKRLASHARGCCVTKSPPRWAASPRECSCGAGAPTVCVSAAPSLSSATASGAGDDLHRRVGIRQLWSANRTISHSTDSVDHTPQCSIAPSRARRVQVRRSAL